MNDHKRFLALFLLITLGVDLAVAQASAPSRNAVTAASSRKIDRDLMEITIPKLEQLYRTHQYTVTDVARWYVARIERYNGIYRAVQTLDATGALATAARLDAEAKAGGAGFVRGHGDRYGEFRFSRRQTPVCKGWSRRTGGKASQFPGWNCSRRETQRSLGICAKREQ